MTVFTGAATPLTRECFHEVLADLGVGIAELVAVLKVESKSCGFQPDRRPKILFERHYFHRLTGGAHSAKHPDISNASSGGYTLDEYARLQRAIALDRTAALKSASWGAGQVMGDNHKMVGFDDVEGMVAAMVASEDDHLRAVANFIRAKKLVDALRKRDWATFARGYNGPAFQKNKYDIMLAGKYQELKSGTLPDLNVRTVQLYLTYLGHGVGEADGLYGRKSRGAVVDYRMKKGIAGGERIDKALIEMLREDVAAL